MLAVGGPGTTQSAVGSGAAQVRREFRGHLARASCLRFPPDGRILVSASKDTTSKLIWRILPRQVHLPFHSPNLNTRSLVGQQSLARVRSHRRSHRPMPSNGDGTAYNRSTPVPFNEGPVRRRLSHAKGILNEFKKKPRIYRRDFRKQLCDEKRWRTASPVILGTSFYHVTRTFYHLNPAPGRCIQCAFLVSLRARSSRAICREPKSNTYP